MDSEKFQKQDKQQEDLDNWKKWPIINFITKTLVITELEIRKLKHDPTELISRVIQPIMWLLIFGEVLAHARAIPTGHMSYLAFMAPGVLAQSVLFVSIFYGIAVIWERDLGIVYKFLSSPAPRTSLVLGKAISAGIRGFSQAIIVYILALLLKIPLNLNIWALLGVLIFILLGAIIFSTFSLIIACIVKVRERFMGIGQLLTMPLFFASNAIYPIAIMPRWLQIFSHVNPLTYEIDAIRHLMVLNAPSVYGLGKDFGVLLLASIIIVWIGSKIYPNIAT
jgi:ABC-2 type transport system permease protein